MSDSLRPHGLYSPWSSPGQNTGVSSLSLLQGIFPTQGSNPGLPHCRRILYQPSHKGRPKLGVKLLISFSKKLSLSWISSSWKTTTRTFSSVQFSSVAQSCPTLCDQMNHSMPSLPVHHQLPEFTQTHVHRVSDAIQPSHPLSSPSPPVPNLSQHQGLFQWVNSSHEVAKVLEFQP